MERSSNIDFKPITQIFYALMFTGWDVPKVTLRGVQIRSTTFASIVFTREVGSKMIWVPRSPALTEI